MYICILQKNLIFSLICSVNYKTIADEKMYFRKFFKFPVAKPIDVKTKFYNAEARLFLINFGSCGRINSACNF